MVYHNIEVRMQKSLAYTMEENDGKFLLVSDAACDALARITYASAVEAKCRDHGLPDDRLHFCFSIRGSSREEFLKTVGFHCSEGYAG